LKLIFIDASINIWKYIIYKYFSLYIAKLKCTLSDSQICPRLGTLAIVKRPALCSNTWLWNLWRTQHYRRTVSKLSRRACNTRREGKFKFISFQASMDPLMSRFL